MSGVTAGIAGPLVAGPTRGDAPAVNLGGDQGNRRRLHRALTFWAGWVPGPCRPDLDGVNQWKVDHEQPAAGASDAGR